MDFTRKKFGLWYGDFTVLYLLKIPFEVRGMSELEPASGRAVIFTTRNEVASLGKGDGIEDSALPADRRPLITRSRRCLRVL